MSITVLTCSSNRIYLNTKIKPTAILEIWISRINFNKCKLFRRWCFLFQAIWRPSILDCCQSFKVNIDNFACNDIIFYLLSYWLPFQILSSRSFRSGWIRFTETSWQQTWVMRRSTGKFLFAICWNDFSLYQVLNITEYSFFRLQLLNSVPRDFYMWGMVLYHNFTKHCRWIQVHSTISFDARFFFVVQISLSMLVFSCRL